MTSEEYIAKADNLRQRISAIEDRLNEAEERTDVIVKVGNKWKVKGKKQKYWDADYDTKADAQAALRAYWANKHESVTNSNKKTLVERYRESK